MNLSFRRKDDYGNRFLISVLSKVVIGAWKVIGSERTNQIAPNQDRSLFFER